VYYAEWGSRSRFRGNREDEAQSESTGDFIVHQMKFYMLSLLSIVVTNFSSTLKIAKISYMLFLFVHRIL
jgi:hypothetical protein